VSARGSRGGWGGCGVRVAWSVWMPFLSVSVRVEACGNLQFLHVLMCVQRRVLIPTCSLLGLRFCDSGSGSSPALAGHKRGRSRCV
jgi:hypothetical protein